MKKALALLVITVLPAMAQLPKPGSGPGGGGTVSLSGTTEGASLCNIGGVLADCPPGTYAADVASSDPWTISGATHGLESCDVSVTTQTESAGVRTWVIPAGWTCDEATFDISIDFASATAGRVAILKNGGGGGGGGGVADPGANGVMVRTALDTTTARTITAGNGTSVADGNGVSANPTITNTAPLYYGADAGGDDAYAVSPSGFPAALATGQALVLTVTTANTGAATINVATLGAKAIKKGDGTTDPDTGDIAVGVPHLFIYNAAANAAAGAWIFKPDAGGSASFPAATAYQVYRRNSDDTADEAATVTAGACTTVTPSSGQITISVDGSCVPLLAQNNAFLGNNAYAGTTTQTPSATQTLVAGDAITVSTITFKSISAASGITLTSTPTIADGNAGQELILVNDGSNNITLQDEANLAGSNLCLPADTNITLAPKEALRGVMSVTSACWIFFR